MIDDAETVESALRTVGFEVLEAGDLAVQTGPSVPWYEPVVGVGPVPGELSQFQLWAPANAQYADGSGSAALSAKGYGNRFGHAEPVRGGNGGGGPPGNFHADVLYSRPQTGLKHEFPFPLSHLSHLKPRLLSPSWTYTVSPTRESLICWRYTFSPTGQSVL